MSRIITGILLLGMASLAGIQAQDFGFQAGIGVHASRMDDMKYVQEYMLETYPVDGKIVSSFPVYATGSLRLVKKLYHDVRIGAGYSYSTTGGRTNYSDYTGNINTDVLASSHRLGGYAAYTLFGGEWYDLSAYGQLDVNFTRIDINTTMYVMGYQDGVMYEYKSISPSGTVGLEFFFHLNDFSLGLSAGYQIDGPGKLTDLDTEENLTDPYDRDRVLTSDWSGWQAHILFLIWF